MKDHGTAWAVLFAITAILGVLFFVYWQAIDRLTELKNAYRDEATITSPQVGRTDAIDKFILLPDGDIRIFTTPAGAWVVKNVSGEIRLARFTLEEKP